MWALLQYVSGSMAKNSISEFLPVLRLFSLFDETSPLPVPDLTNPDCVQILSPVTIFLVLSNKMKSEKTQLQFDLPIALRAHYHFIDELGISSNLSMLTFKFLILIYQ